jgi:hypothetical protein
MMKIVIWMNKSAGACNNVMIMIETTSFFKLRFVSNVTLTLHADQNLPFRLPDSTTSQPDSLQVNFHVAFFFLFSQSSPFACIIHGENEVPRV